MRDGGTRELMGRDWCQIHREEPQSLASHQEERPASDHPPTGLPAGRMSCDGSCAAAPPEGSGYVLSLGETHGKKGRWIILSSFATAAPAQEEGPAPSSTPVVHLGELDAGADPGAALDLEGCPPSMVGPPLAAAPAAILELGLDCELLLT